MTTQPPSVYVTCKNQTYVDTIRRVVRAHMGKIRTCYEAGLARDPSLEGTVRVKFVIERSGKVSAAIDDGSTLPDKTTTQCIVGVFAGMEFPEHDGMGYVTYPVHLAPGGAR